MPRCLLIALLLTLGSVAPAQRAATAPVAGAATFAPVWAAPGQVWTLGARTAEGEAFQTTLVLATAAPTQPGVYRADRGSLLLDPAVGTLIALDLQDARQGGLGLACAVSLPPGPPPQGAAGLTLPGVLAAGTLAQLPARLEAALAVLGVTRTPQERAQAAAELKLGECTLTRFQPRPAR